MNIDESPMTLWPQATINAVLADIAAGATVEKACARPGAPSRTTFFRWLSTDAALAEQYASAVKAQTLSRYLK